MAVLLRGVFPGIKHSARVMRPRDTGSIINPASIAGLHTGYGSVVYSTANAGVIHMSRCAAVELGACGVRVNAIRPGAIITRIFGKAFGRTHADALQTTAALAKEVELFQPIHWPGAPSDIAHAALWLAGDDSGFVNGHALVVDGGLTGGLSHSAAFAQFGKLAAVMGIAQPESE
jgi:NAD(P)-dependent dehydrogenase (short-subunit alcohol dehydrogenase family)